MKMLGGETHSPLLPRLQVSLYMCVPPHWEIMTWQTDVGGDYFWDSLPLPNVISSSFRSLCFRERLCAFCYCGSRSLLGQGDLQVFSITPQLEALFSHEDGGGSASDSSDGDQTTQPNMPGETTSGQRDKTESVRYSKLTFLSMQIVLYVCLKLCLLYLLSHFATLYLLDLYKHFFQWVCKLWGRTWANQSILGWAVSRWPSSTSQRPVSLWVR